MDTFYITLPSDSSKDIYPKNSPSNYTTKLKQGATLVGQYEVAVTEIQFKFDFHNFTTEDISFDVLIDEDQLVKLVAMEKKYYDATAYSQVSSRTSKELEAFYKLWGEVINLTDNVAYSIGASPQYIQERNQISNIVFHAFNSSNVTTVAQIDPWLYVVVNAIKQIVKFVDYYFNMWIKMQAATLTVQAHYRSLQYQLLDMINNFRSLIKNDTSENSRQKRSVDGSEETETVSAEHEPAETVTVVSATPRMSSLHELTDELKNVVGLKSPTERAFEMFSKQLQSMLKEAEAQNKNLSELSETIATMPFQHGDDLFVLKSTALYSVVPIVFLPYVISDGKRKFQIPVKIPSGYYKDPPALVVAMNKVLRHSCALRNLHKLAHFTYDASEAKISVQVDHAVTIRFVDKKFSRLIGMSDMDGPLSGLIIGDNQVTYHENWQLMYIYSDVVDYNHVGHSMAQLLRVIPATGEPNAYTVIRFNTPHFLPVLKNELGTLEVQLLNEHGEQYLMKSGKTIITLQFRPRIKHIF